MIFLALGSNLTSSFGDRFKNINLTMSYLEGYKIQIIKKYLGYNLERTGNITSRPYHRKFKNLFCILYQNKNDVNYLIVLYRFIRIIFTLEWFKFIFM